MTGQMFIALLALIAVLVVLLWAVVDHTYAEDETATGPVLIDQSGRLIGATEEMPVFRPGKHRAGWFR